MSTPNPHPELESAATRESFGSRESRADARQGSVERAGVRSVPRRRLGTGLRRAVLVFLAGIAVVVGLGFQPAQAVTLHKLYGVTSATTKVCLVTSGGPTVCTVSNGFGAYAFTAPSSHWYYVYVTSQVGCNVWYNSTPWFWVYDNSAYELPVTTTVLWPSRFWYRAC